MMSGLAYMTGFRKAAAAGASVVESWAGFRRAYAIQAALLQRQRTRARSLVECALFETAAFLMGQHLAYAAKVGGTIPPMPERVSAWAIYELFTAAEGKKIFIGIVSDAQWVRFCKVLACLTLQPIRD